jgi:16S rRNA (uracil1498-N3)-methyltransferase
VAHAYFAEHLDDVHTGDVVEVTGEEARHAVSVARLRAGERIDLLDGRGTRVAATVLEADRDRFTARAETDALLEPEPAPRIQLVQALAKGGRDELALQAAVELGIDEVVPWQSQRSVVKWQGEKQRKQRARWQTIAREASKQALRARVPEVRDVVSTKQLAGFAESTTLVVLDPVAERTLTEFSLTGSDSFALVVGPEGGIDAAEFALLEEAGAVRCRLGTNVLRTSTAGPAALATLLTRLGRW